jgi:protein-tyrosine phosphatase
MVPALGPSRPLSTASGAGGGAPVQPGERRIALQAAVNVRDLGGYAAADGRTTRWRTLFRADDLSTLTRTDRAVVRRLGIATVIDLRSKAEVDLGRFPVEEIPVGFHHLPLLATLPAFDEYRTPDVFLRHYGDIARESGDRIGRALSIVARRDAHPVVVHCAAGKDRTGVLVAVLLALLGVPDGTIAEDYALSARAMEALLARLLERVHDQEELIASVATRMFDAAPGNILGLLEGLRAAWGTVEAYAAAHGAGPDVVGALRDGLLE